MKTIAYVYKWIELSSGRWYIGSRTEKGCHPNDGYITSSKGVLKSIKHNPSNWKREILETGTPQDMLSLEHELLKTLDAKHSIYSFNLNNGMSHNPRIGSKSKKLKVNKPLVELSTPSNKLTKEEKENLLKIKEESQKIIDEKTSVILNSVKDFNIETIKTILDERVDTNGCVIDKFTENLLKIIKNVADAGNVTGCIKDVVKYIKKNRTTLNMSKKLYYNKLCHDIMDNSNHPYHKNFIALRDSVKPNDKLLSDGKRLLVIKHLQYWFINYLRVEMNQTSLSNIFDAMFNYSKKTIRDNFETIKEYTIESNTTRFTV